jgi:hypothetical protein
VFMAASWRPLSCVDTIVEAPGIDLSCGRAVDGVELVGKLMRRCSLDEVERNENR